MPVATFTANVASPLKNRTRESEVKQIPIQYTSGEILLKSNKSFKKPQNCSRVVIVLRSIHRVEKKTTHGERQLIGIYVLRNVNIRKLFPSIGSHFSSFVYEIILYICDIFIFLHDELVTFYFHNITVLRSSMTYFKTLNSGYSFPKAHI